MNWAIGRGVPTISAAILLMLSTGVRSETPVSETEAPRIVFIGAWDRAMPLVERASRETGIEAGAMDAEDAVGDDAARRLDSAQVVYLLNLAPELADPLRKVFEAEQTQRPGFKVIPLDARDVHATFRNAGVLHDDPNVPLYWRSNGLENIRRLLTYTRATYLGGDDEIQPPVQVPDTGYYVPEAPDEALAELSQVTSRPEWRAGAPTAAMLIHQSFWVTGDTEVIDAEIHALRERGINAVALFAGQQDDLHRMLLEAAPDLLIEDRHGGTWETAQGKNFLEALDVPYLRPISMLAYTAEQWRADPRGLHPRDRSHYLALQEIDGTIEPIVVGGLKAGITGYRLHEPIPGRIDRFADRAARWLTLRSKPNAEKRIAIIYYSKSLGEGDLLRGSPTGAFLDGPESLIRFLPRLAKRGYTLGDDVPETAPALLERVKAHGRNIGPWAQGELDAMADQEEVVLISMPTYMRWFEGKLDEAQRQAVIESHGPPPGKLMVVRRNGDPFIVIPTLQLGNVLLTPQPERGEKQDEALLHSSDVPPPHNYLAFYWWLQEEFKADAIMHWGTHGSLELLPGKEAGLTARDWSDECVGTMPVVNLWIMDNLGEATLSRRRSYALLVDHLVPPAVTVAVASETRKLNDDLHKFETLEKGLVRAEYRKQVSEAAIEQRFDEILNFDAGEDGLLNDAQLKALHDHLHVLIESRTPTSLHILGQRVDREKVPGYLTSILGADFIERVAHTMPAGHGGNAHGNVTQRAETIIAASVLGDEPPPAGLENDVADARNILARLDRTDDEIVNLLRGLEGRYIAPGPGPDPIRNPGSAPSGRNLYALNPEEIPTRAAWNVAVRLVDQMLEKNQPKKVGMDLNGMNTMRDFGVMEGQILYLMGVRPVWDANRLCIDVELIPREELGRPRIDVFIAMGGQYKENFPSRVKLLDKAVRLVSQLEEEDNLVRAGTLAMRQKLLGMGFSEDRADVLAAARIFGTKPGNLSGTNILYLVPRSGVWERDDEIASVYIDSMSYVYTGDVWGKKIDGLYQEAIQGTDTLVRIWASNMTSQLSNHHAYEYLGGLSLAVTKLTGKEPTALIADVRDPSRARIRRFEEVLDTSLRSELLNEDWIRGMKAHDYAGAGMMAELVKNTFGWDVTRSSAVSDGVWDEIYQTYVEDSKNLDLPEWFEQVNPHAMQTIAATMLEAARKGYWDASAQQLARLSEVYARSVAKHGASMGLVAGGNDRLNQFVTDRLTAPGLRPLADALAKAVADSEGAAGEDTSKVYGAKLQEAKQDQAATPTANSSRPGLWNWWMTATAALAGLAFLIGIWKRVGSSA